MHLRQKRREAARRAGFLRSGVVAEHGGAEPALRLRDAILAAAPRVVDDLVLIDLAHVEVFGLGVREDEGADGGSGKHHEGVRQPDPAAQQGLDLEQVEEGLLLAVVRLGGVARGRADALVLDLEHVIQAHVLVRRVAPELLADLDVDELRVRLAQAICNRVEKNGLVNLAARVEILLHLLHAHSARARERTDVISLSGNEVRMAHRDVLVHILLLSQAVERHGLLLGAIDDDVITNPASGPNADDRMGLNQTSGNNLIHHLIRLIVHLLCHRAARLIFEDVRIPLVRVLPAQVVQAEERAPIDVLADFRQVVLLEGNVPNGDRLGRGLRCEINLHALGLSLLDRQPLLVYKPLVVFGADLIVLVLDVVQVVLRTRSDQLLHHGHRTGCVQNMDRFLALRCELHRSVWRFEVVAPPTRSGCLKPWASISFAMWTISSRDGVINPETPMTSTLCSVAASRIVWQGTITPISITW